MFKVSKLVVAAACGLAVMMAVPSVYAQDSATTGSQEGRGDRGGRRGGGLYQVALGLTGITDEQKQKIEKLQTESREKMRAAREKGGERPDWQKAMTETRTQIEAILTDDQKKEFETKVKEMRPMGRGGREGRDGGTTETK